MSIVVFYINLIDNPKLTCEEAKIDLLIRENNKYAIIIENKACNAIDQSKQLKRYIDYCKSVLKYSDSQIYVLYLPKYRKNPSQESIDNATLKTLEQNKKFAVVDFFDDIYDWLNDATNIPNINEACKFALKQYKDYLYDFLDKGNLEIDKLLKDQLITEGYITNTDTVDISIENIHHIDELIKINSNLATRNINHMNEFIFSLIRIRKELWENLLKSIGIQLKKEFQYKVYSGSHTLSDLKIIYRNR